MKGRIIEILDKFLRDISVSVDYAVEYPKSDKFGDYSTNLAMILASKTRKNPREVAKDIVEYVRDFSIFERVEIAGAGFINFFIRKEAFLSELKDILDKNEGYFRPDIEKKSIQVEFVSANPTGPLHVGHGRGAAIGDSIARILSFCGHRVEREYYINDAGLQMHLLGLSTFIRYKQLMGYDDVLPEDGYKGDYLVDIAKDLMLQYGEALLKKDEDEAIEICKQRAADVILKNIMDTLNDFRVRFDKVFNEKKLYDQHEIDESVEYLKEKGLVYEKDGALWFKSSEFGDEKDRVIKRSNGAFTYFASDIAYHRNKFLKRKFDKVIDVWGSDHHGYVKRVKAAINAFGINPDRLEVVLVQIVNLLRNGEKVSMSTRKAEFVELRSVLDEVGVDAARFMFVSRSIDAHLDFDLELAKKQSNDNPVYYVQYAYARISSILSQVKDIERPCDGFILGEKEEIDLIKGLIIFKELIEKAHDDVEPYFVVKGLLDISERFHRFYNKHRVIGSEKNIMLSRIALIEAVKIALKLGFDLIGVEAKERM